jgi:hypothetical protein
VFEVTDLSPVEASILLSCRVNVHCLALSAKDYPCSRSLVWLRQFRTQFVSDYRFAEKVYSSLFKVKLFFSLFVITSDSKDEVLVCLVCGRLRLRSDNLMDVLVQDGSF